MENKNILDMDFEVFMKIKNILEDKNIRESFLEVLPPGFCSHDFLIEMDVEGQKPNMSPARWLLMYLGSRGICVADLICWFEEMNLENALSLLKKDEPLRIIEQPPERIAVSEGAEIEITVKAASYPPPEYQWYKDGQELLLHYKPTLSILDAKLMHGGIYKCQVAKTDTKTGACVWLCSTPVEVVIVKKDNVLHRSKEWDGNLRANEITYNHVIDIPEEKDKAIKIIRQPYVHGKIAQGMSISLHCEAESLYPVKYQWFKNGMPLEGEISTKLELNCLYPDSITSDTEWTYQCVVNNIFCHSLSTPVTVELDNIVESTPYIAEDKIAFLVANDTYLNLPELKKPSPDVVDMAELLSSMKFKIFAVRNLNLLEMKNAVHIFCRMLRPKVYALFFFAGHGFEEFGQTYLLPIDCSDKYLKEEAICTEYVLKCMQKENPEVNILLIDSCRMLSPQANKRGYSFSFKDRQVAKMKGNTIYGYSTSDFYSSYESDVETNGYFVKYLKKHLTKNRKIVDILNLVLQDFKNEPLIKKHQYPQIKSSLATPMKLCDPVESVQKPVPFGDIMSCPGAEKSLLEKLLIKTDVCYFLLNFYHHQHTFCNAFDIKLYLIIPSSCDMKTLLNFEVDIAFQLDSNGLIPAKGVCLNDFELKYDEKNFLFTKTILSAQKIKEEKLNGAIVLKIRSSQTISLPFSSTISNKLKCVNFLNQSELNEK